jgi:hypothetical protein
MPTKKSTTKKSTAKKMCFMPRADWALAIALLLNLRFDQQLILHARTLLESIFTKKYPQEVLANMPQDQFESLQTTFTHLDATITFGLGFLLPALALLLALSVREKASSKVLVAVSMMISVLVMLTSLISAIGYIINIS